MFDRTFPTCWAGHALYMLDRTRPTYVGQDMPYICWTGHALYMLDRTRPTYVGQDTPYMCWTGHVLQHFSLATEHHVERSAPLKDTREDSEHHGRQLLQYEL